MATLNELKDLARAADVRLKKAEARVSLIQEGVADLTEHTSPEGRIARREAVRAAVASGDEVRATSLARRFIKGAAGDSDLAGELIGLLPKLS